MDRRRAGCVGRYGYNQRKCAAKPRLHSFDRLIDCCTEKRVWMDRVKQSISWWRFAHGDMTIERMMRLAADIRYESIELVEQEHWQVIKDHGLTNASLKHLYVIE